MIFRSWKNKIRFEERKKREREREREREKQIYCISATFVARYLAGSLMHIWNDGIS